MVLDHYLIIKEWFLNFHPFSDTTERMLVWERLPCLPIEYYDREFLLEVGKKIRKPVRVD